MTASSDIRASRSRHFKDSDANGKVIYLGTFSKSIAPAIRMSYMVLPEASWRQFIMKNVDLSVRRFPK